MLKKYCKLNDSNYCNINYIVYSPEKKDNNLEATEKINVKTIKGKLNIRFIVFLSEII